MYFAAGHRDDTELKSLCESAYNNRQRVPEHPAHIAGWQRDAAAYREAAQGELDLAYGEAARNRLDLFWPAQANRDTCPIAVFIHGGYWQGLDKSFFSHLARGANAHGVALALPSYTLCPQTDIGGIIEEMAAACLFLWRRHGRRLAVCGHSAGGHLTAALLQRDFTADDAKAPADLARHGVPLSGLFDLRDLLYTSINDKVGMTMADAVAWSPLLHDAPQGRMLHSYVGADESDAFIWQSQTIADIWAEAGNETKHVATRRADGGGDDHFTIAAHLADPGSAMTQSLVALAKAACFCCSASGT